MAHINSADRVLESTTTTGTGDITLAAALVGFRRFSTVVAIGDTVPYFIEAIDSQGLPSGDYEYGIATYSALNTLSRTNVQGSSNGGALVAFNTGSKNVGVPALAGALVPVGMRCEFLGSTVPLGYLELDGSLKSRIQYPALWAYAQASGILAASDGAWTKAQFSPGDGATTFRVPDHRGYHSRAWDHGAGVDAGRAIATLQADQMPAHGHGVNEPPHAHGVNEAPHAHTTSIPAKPNNPGAGPFAVVDGASGITSSLGVGSQGATTGISIQGATTGISIQAAGVGTESRVKTISVLVCVKT